MGIGDSYVFEGYYTGTGTPPINDVFAGDDEEMNLVDPFFRVTQVENFTEDIVKFTATQLSAGTLPVSGDYVFSDLGDVGGYGGAVYDWNIELTEDAYLAYVFSPPNDMITYRRLVAAAANKIWYEAI